MQGEKRKIRRKEKKTENRRENRETAYVHAEHAPRSFLLATSYAMFQRSPLLNSRCVILSDGLLSKLSSCHERDLQDHLATFIVHSHHESPFG